MIEYTEKEKQELIQCRLIYEFGINLYKELSKKLKDVKNEHSISKQFKAETKSQSQKG